MTAQNKESTVNDAYFIEIHRAKEVFSLLETSMNALRRLKANELLKDSILVDLNKIRQWLLLPNLKVINESDPRPFGVEAKT